MLDPMKPYYLGYVEFIHEEGWGRIRPLASVRKRSVDDAWVVDRNCEPDEMGSTGLVFWPKIPPDQNHLARHYVRFKVEPNQRAHDRDRDEFVVAEEWRNGTVRRVATLGLAILPDHLVHGRDRVLAADSGTTADAIVFQRRMNNTFINGPWRVGKVDGSPRLCLQPKDDGHVVEHELGRLDPKTFLIWSGTEGEAQAVLLVEPPRATGRLNDLLPDTGLADWLIRMLRRDTSLLATIDRAAPGWRGRIGDLLAHASDSSQAALDRGRFVRLEAALDFLSSAEARLADLAELPRFQAILEVAIGNEVAAARARIEAAAQEETRKFVSHQSQIREQAKAQAEREKKGLLREVDKIREEVAEAGRLHEQYTAKAERDESSLRAAADYLVASKERIIRDFAAFQGLVEEARVSGGGSANGNGPAVAGAFGPPLPKGIVSAPEGPEIHDPGDFLRTRLTPSLAAWGAGATRLHAKRLHAALLACRWVAAPCPSWGAAYAEAVGADARLRIVAVEPTWLAFADAWRGEVEAFWSEAAGRRDALHLLIFADADRALVQCWARPLLDVVSGLRATLPSGLPWPENLRVMACPSADDAALPVPAWVLAHWAGVKPSIGATRPDDPFAPGHVPWAAWRAWVEAPEADPRLSEGLGVAARSAARERSALTRTFLRLDPNDDPESADEVAREIRELDARAIFAREARG